MSNFLEMPVYILSQCVFRTDSKKLGAWVNK